MSRRNPVLSLPAQRAIVSDALGVIPPIYAEANDQQQIVPELLTLVPEAFASVRPALDHARVFHLVSHSRREAAVTAMLEAGPLLSHVTCGAPVGALGDESCGRALHGYRIKHGVRYASRHCCTGEFAHVAIFSNALEAAVEHVLAEAYRPEAIHTMLSQARRLMPKLRSEQTELGERLARLKYEREVTVGLEVEAAKANRPTDFDAYTMHRHAVELQIGDVQRDLDRVTAHLHGASIAEDLDRIAHLAAGVASRVERLLTATKAFPTLRHRLVSLLMPVVRVRSLCRCFLLVECILPSGRAARRIVCTGQQASVQPLRTYVTARLRAGDDIELLGKELDILLPSSTRGWTHTSETLQALAIHHLYFETEQARAGTTETTKAFAERHALSHKEVLRMALEGRLGPVLAVDNGEIAIQPSDVECAVCFESLERQRIAAVHGWNSETTTHTRAFAALHGTTAARVYSGIAHLRGEFVKGLDGKIWFDFRRLPESTSGRVERWKETNPASVSRSLHAEFDSARRDAVREAGFDPSLARSFYPPKDLLDRLRVRYRVPLARSTLSMRANEHFITQVRYNGPHPTFAGGKRPLCLFYCPDEVWNGSAKDTYRRYLRGHFRAPGAPEPKYGRNYHNR